MAEQLESGKESKLDKLLLEGSESNQMLGEMANYFRVQNQLNIKGFFRILGTIQDSVWEKILWSQLIQLQQDISKAAKLGEIVPFFHEVH